MYSWIQTHLELVQWLEDKENQQPLLIQTLKDLGIEEGFRDISNNGRDRDIDLTEIDPFTFMRFLYKYGEKKRLETLQKLAQMLHLTIPNDVSGIPSSNPQSVWLFSSKFERTNNDVSKLWKLFYECHNNTISDETFEDVLNIKYSAKKSITESLFLVNPTIFLPINTPVIKYFESKQISTDFGTYKDYISIIDDAKERLGKECYEISFDAWEENDKAKKNNYWLYAPGNNAIMWDEFYNDGVLGIGWDKLGDLHNYKSKIEIESAINKRYPNGKDGKLSIQMNFDFAYEMNIGDIIIAKKGISEIIGHGEIKSEYYYDEQAKDFKSRRRVKWVSKGSWKSKILPQKTLTKITDNKQYFIDLIEKTSIAKSKFQSVFDSLNPKDVAFYFEVLRKVIHTFNLKSDDPRLTFTVSHNNLNFTIGQRYFWRLYNSQPSKFAIATTKVVHDSSDRYHGHKPPFYSEMLLHEIDDSTISTFYEAIAIELQKTTRSSFHKSNNQDFINFLFGINLQNTDNPMSTIPINLPKNLILYGPPGTGKTYRLKNEYFAKFTDQQSLKTKEDYIDEIIVELPWWSVLTLVLLDLKSAKVAQIKEHKFVQKKLKNNENKKNVNQRIWGTLQQHTVLDCENVNYKNKSSSLVFWKNENSVWSIPERVDTDLIEEYQHILETFNSYNDEYITKKYYEFVSFHQSYSYEDFIEGIKPVLDSGDLDNDGRVLEYEIVDGIFKRICIDAKANPKQDYAIFIDEINRGNVAQIFGELITLIEDDKRVGADNELSVTLPYSKESFSVPSNLHIIGTMNTADRSVEALDTALRRRFDFVEMQPDPNQLKHKSQLIELDRLLRAMNERIELLVDKDYCVGHSYFFNINESDIENSLRTVFKNKIIPLLQEYFYSDWAKIGLVLGNGFVTKKQNQVKLLSQDEFDIDDSYSGKLIVEIKNSETWTIEDFRSIYDQS